jgi:hypothetical protein
MLRFLSVLLIVAVQLSAQYEAVNSKIDSLLQEKFFESTVASVSAYNLTKDEPVYKKNQTELFKTVNYTAIFIFMEMVILHLVHQISIL